MVSPASERGGIPLLPQDALRERFSDNLEELGRDGDKGLVNSAGENKLLRPSSSAEVPTHTLLGTNLSSVTAQMQQCISSGLRSKQSRTASSLTIWPKVFSGNVHKARSMYFQELAKIKPCHLLHM